MQRMILLALGGNLGDRHGNLAAARRRLGMAGVAIVAQSAMHETTALLPRHAAGAWNIAYLNQVIAVQTALSPQALLARTQRIEAELGRRSAPSWAPQAIDIDLLAFDSVVLSSPDLTLPHPQLHLRRFVLAPLCEIAADWVHPVLQRRAHDLLFELAA